MSKYFRLWRYILTGKYEDPEQRLRRITNCMRADVLLQECDIVRQNVWRKQRKKLPNWRRRIVRSAWRWWLLCRLPIDTTSLYFAGDDETISLLERKVATWRRCFGVSSIG